MDSAVRAILFERLVDDPDVSDETTFLVLAACEGTEALAALLDDGVEPAEPGPSEGMARPPHAFLRTVTVEGFRGIGPPATLELTPGPGLTLVVGRNGSGKSSFAEGLELLLTGDSMRWRGRSQVWKEGWRCLHHGTARIEAGLVIEGTGPVTVRRTWPDGAGLEDGEASAQPRGQPKMTLEALGWGPPLATYRPFLSYSELGSLLDEGPAKLYDAASAILGLEALVDADKTLSAARLAHERDVKAVKADLKGLLEALDGLDDERATQCLAALRKRPPDIAAAEEVLRESEGVPGADGELETLRKLKQLEPPDLEACASAARRLREADARQVRLSGTQAARAAAIAGLLEAAAKLHDAHGDEDCPVCGTPGALGGEWRQRASEEAEQLRRLSSEVKTTEATLDAARRAAHGLLTPPPTVVERAAALGLQGAELESAWRSWAAGGSLTDPQVLAAHLDEHAEGLALRVHDLAEAAAAKLRGLEDIWRPVSLQVAAWLERAHRAGADAPKIDALKRAEAWLSKAATALRNERFAPIADEAKAIWELLRHRSSVELERIGLVGARTRRHVALEVTIDGVDGAALGVMSQGELHALALSLFIPRATLAESPFGFVVIDDPVQSMDPAKIDGLARALDRTARERQVVVFTHDDRLPEAVRRLGIDATVVEVTRRERSVVELRVSLDPVVRHLEDARALVRTQELSREVAARVVPGFCRAAIEAACVAAVRRRRLARGDSHQDVEELLTRSSRLTVLAALALHDDPEKGGAVLGYLNNAYGKRAADAFQAVNRGAHHGYDGDLDEIVRSASTLALQLRDLQ